MQGINPKSQFEFVPRDTEKSEFLDVVDFGNAEFSVKIVIQKCCLRNRRRSPGKSLIFGIFLKSLLYRWISLYLRNISQKSAVSVDFGDVAFSVTMWKQGFFAQKSRMYPHKSAERNDFGDVEKERAKECVCVKEGGR